MQSHTLKRLHPNYRSPRVGRGGKRGKTSGRGGKGQTARAGHKMRPQMRDIIKKLPKRRGYGKNRSRTIRGTRVILVPVNLAALESAYTANGIVNPKTLFAKGLARGSRGRLPRVKILGAGALTKPLSVSGCTVSASARKAIEAAGGSIL